jgi:hypothetical protein
MAKKKFPKLMYVKRVNKGTDDEFFSADKDYKFHAEPNEEITIGVYELKFVRILVNKSELME